jgi:hypothetical protein
MTLRRIYVLTCLLLAGVCCWAESGTSGEITAAVYRAELQQLLAASAQLETTGNAVPPVLDEVPPSWQIRIGPQLFDIPTEGLRRDIRNFQKKQTPATASAVRSRIESLRLDLDGYEASAPDVARSRERLGTILARREFRDVSGPTLLDRLKQWLLGLVIKLLQRLFQSSAIPVISRVFVYGLIGLAVLTLGLIAYRQINESSAQESVVPTEVLVSARSWQLRLAEAREAAAHDNWREAIHLAYWAGISFLEQHGIWKPDRARTPREYLRLLSNPNEQREALAALTRIFELTWYASREADAATFSQTMQALEKLGCHSN